jgi:hypothetical protein
VVMEGEIDRRQHDEGKKDVDDGGVELAAHSGVGDGGGAAPRGGGGRWGRGGETVRGATSPDDGVPTYGIYSAAARAGAVLVMVGSLRSTL